MSNYGLNTRQLHLIKDILKHCTPAVDCVYLYGSRAKGNYHSYSDIDLIVHGSLDEGAIDRLWTCFHESPLPYKVDIHAYHLIHYPPLKEHIDRFGKLLFSKEQLIN